MTKKYDYYKIREIVSEKYGEPCSIGSKGNILKLNSQYFAGFFLCLYLPIYAINDDSFHLFKKSSGIWKNTSRHRMIELIGRFIHEYALFFNDLEISDKRTQRLCQEVFEYLKGQAESVDIFTTGYTGPPYVHCLNSMLVFDERGGGWIEMEFSREFLSRKTIPVAFNKSAQCSRFLKHLLGGAVSEDDIKILQLYLGQCLLGQNSSQTFLLLTGTAGGGKSTLLNVVEGIIGPGSCTELRLEHIGGRFEMGRYAGKTLLSAKDVSSDFLQLKASKKLKSLIGDDRVTTEYKNENSVKEMKGAFNVILSLNATPQIEFDDDMEAWKRRVLWIKYERPPASKKIVHFDEILLREEGPGILNWALEGAAQLLKAGGKILKTPEQEARVSQLMAYSQPFKIFADRYICPTQKSSITTSEVLSAFAVFCKKVDCPLLPERKIQHLFHEYMRSKFGAVLRTDIKYNGKNKRGYVGYQIRNKKEV